MDLEITSIVGGCTEIHDDMPNKQELKEEPTPEVSDTRNGLFAEMERDDPGNIDISSLSLSIDLEEVTILRKIFEENQK